MRIVHVNTHGLAGGASIVARNLVAQQRLDGHDVSMIFAYGDKTSPDSGKIPFDFGGSGLRRSQEYCLRKLSRIEARMGLQYCFMTPAWLLERHAAVRDADIVHFHNTHGGYLNLWAVSNLSRRRPVVWTLHDEWAYTGHCATTLGCDRWRTGCGHCPRLRVNPDIRLDTTRLLFRFKSAAYRRGRFVIACPSRWLFERVGEGMLGCRRRYLVPNPVDTGVFRPRERDRARERLGLPREAMVVMFAAHFGARNPLKGFDDFARALAGLEERERSAVCLLGVGDDGSGAPALPVRTHWAGRIDDPALMAEHYAAADVFVLPSHAENSPLTILEAMACGTGALAYDVGGVAELITHEASGYVARYRDVADLTAGLRWFLGLSSEERRRLSSACLEAVRDGHELASVARRYEAIYDAVHDAG